MEKILFLGAGSERDPGFDSVKIDGQPMNQYMKERGITVLDRVIESCHGCPDLMTRYSKQMQSLVDKGNRAAGVLEGGLLFGLPSIQATQVTYPIISHPLDLVAYPAFMVPSGHAVVAGVGMDANGETKQKAKALITAERMLNFEGNGVFIAEDDEGKLEKELAKFGIKNDNSSSLALSYGGLFPPHLLGLNEGSILVRAGSSEKLKEWGYLEDSEDANHGEYNSDVQVRGVKNLAIYAAKILSLTNPELREAIKEIGKKKRETYPERNLIDEVMGGN